MGDESAKSAQVAAEAAKAERRAERVAAEAALSAERRQAAEVLLAAPAVSAGTERTFGADEELARVYEWASCSGELSELQGGECFEVPRNFSLARTYPRAVLQDRGQSLRNLQLLP